MCKVVSGCLLFFMNLMVISFSLMGDMEDFLKKKQEWDAPVILKYCLRQ